MDITKKVLELGAMEVMGMYTFSEDELKAFYRAVVTECIEIVKPTEYHEAFAQNFLGEFEGLELLHLRVEILERLRGEQDAVVS